MLALTFKAFGCFFSWIFRFRLRESGQFIFFFQSLSDVYIQSTELSIGVGHSLIQQLVSFLLLAVQPVAETSLYLPLSLTHCLQYVLLFDIKE